MSTSKTGLLTGVRRPVWRPMPQGISATQVQLTAEARPAPYTLRPFAGVYNPFPYGCSVLCNHPADCEAREVVKRAKDSWASEPRSVCLPPSPPPSGLLPPYADGEPAVPEALFRRYTDTDSRPQTPAPTLASVSVSGRSRSARRCLTPDPAGDGGGGAGSGGGGGGERPLLVLDLRRSHSQEALSWRALGTPAQPPSPPTHPAQHGGAPSPSGRPGQRPPPPARPPARPPRAPQGRGRRSPAKSSASAAADGAPAGALGPEGSPTPSPRSPRSPPPERLDSPPPSGPEGESGDGEAGGGGGGGGGGGAVRRRGKHRRRRKHGRDGDSAREPAVQGLPDPADTQVSAMDAEAEGAEAERAAVEGRSARASLTPGAGVGAGAGATPEPASGAGATPNPAATDSFLTPALLRPLRRLLFASEGIDFEFDPKRRMALAEAQRVGGHVPAAEAAAEAAATGAGADPDKWLAVPRIVSRQSARFGLPMDSRKLAGMSPLHYLSCHVALTPPRRLLCRLIFERHADESRHIPPEHVDVALAEALGFSAPAEVTTLVTGGACSDEGGEQTLPPLDFRAWCGVAALAERLAARASKPRESDPPTDVEVVDLAPLERRLASARLTPGAPLAHLLCTLRDA